MPANAMGTGSFIRRKLNGKRIWISGNATLIKEEVLLPSKTVERMYPKFSPDGKGKWLSLRTVSAWKCWIWKQIRYVRLPMEAHGMNWVEGLIMPGRPTAKWFTLEFIGNKHDPYTDIALVSADGKGELVNLTNSGYTSSSPKWTMDGNAILFTERYGMRNHASWGSLDDVMMVLSIRMPTTSSAWARRIMNSRRNWEKNRKKLRTRKTERKKIKKKIRKRKPTRWKTSWWNWRAFRTASYVWLRIHRASLRPFFQRMEKVCIICRLWAWIRYVEDGFAQTGNQIVT